MEMVCYAKLYKCQWRGERMESEFLVKINGEGQTLESIASLYLGLIKDDFNMTIDEMADYLSCSYDYVQKNIAPYVHHIYISTS